MTTASSPAPAPASTGLTFSKLHVLVVEDDPVSQHLMRTVLLGAGAQVTLASSGIEAFSKLVQAERVVDVILADYHMPRGNGLQLLKTVRTGQVKYLRPDTCFITITSEAAVEVIQTALRLDVNGYLLKPVTSAKLKAAIEKARGKYFPVDFARYNAVEVPDDDHDEVSAAVQGRLEQGAAS